MSKPVCYFDLETTGTDQSKDRIVSIAIIKVSDGAEQEFYSLVNPEIAIPKGATNVHGITDEQVVNAPKLLELVSRIKELILGSDLAGYNSNNFDIPLLMNELNRVGYAHDLTEVVFFDALKIYTRKEGRTLTDAVRFYTGGDHREAHNALADVRATIEVFKAQRLKYADLPENREELALYCNFDKQRADLSGKFSVDASGDYIFNFGKNKGKKATTDIEYLKWMLTRDFQPDTVSLIKAIITKVTKA